MKIDVEGAELSVLKGTMDTVKRYYPKIFLSTHGIDVHKKCCAFLKSIGYELQSISDKSVDESNEIMAFRK